MESSSDFIVPADFSSEWHNITPVKDPLRTQIYTATRYGRRFVLKALAPEIASLTDYRLQQEQEFRLGIQLVHPNIAATYSLEEIDGVGRCIVQEWIDGQTLAEWFQTSPSKASQERILNQLLDAIEYLHSLQLVHHDLKADNILITRHGTNAKLIDFGLSATDASVSPVSNDPRRDIIALQQLFPSICPKGHFATIDALRKVINRRKRLIRLLPIILTSLLLLSAITLFYLSWSERQKEQQRYETMSEQIDSYIAQERAHILEIINRRDSFDTNNQADMQAYLACHEEWSNYIQSQWLIRDSLMDLYPENDPLREQFWQLWARREAEMSTELTRILSSKRKSKK